MKNKQRKIILNLVQIAANVMDRYEGIFAGYVFAFEVNVCVWWWANAWWYGRCGFHKRIISVIDRMKSVNAKTTYAE